MCSPEMRKFKTISYRSTTDTDMVTFCGDIKQKWSGQLSGNFGSKIKHYNVMAEVVKNHTPL